MVIGEIPQTIVPPGVITGSGPRGRLPIPKGGFPTVVIGGRTRERIPDVYRGGTPPVLEPFDPSVVIGEVTGADTASQEESQDEDQLMAHDWGHLLRQGATEVFGWGGEPNVIPNVGGTAWTQQMAAGAGAAAPGAMPGLCAPMPRYLTYDTKTGEYKLRRRRRRRTLCTPADMACLAQIVAITGKGAAMNIAVSRALK